MPVQMQKAGVGRAEEDEAELCKEGRVLGIGQRTDGKEDDAGRDGKREAGRRGPRQDRAQDAERVVPEQAEEAQVECRDRADEKAEGQDVACVDRHIGEAAASQRHGDPPVAEGLKPLHRAGVRRWNRRQPPWIRSG